MAQLTQCWVNRFFLRKMVKIFRSYWNYNMEHHDYKKEDLQIRSSLLMRVFITFFILFGIFIIIITNFSLTSRFSQETTKQANLRLHLYANLINSEIERSRFLTLLLANDSNLIKLITNDHKIDLEISNFLTIQITLINR